MKQSCHDNSIPTLRSSTSHILPDLLFECITRARHGLSLTDPVTDFLPREEDVYSPIGLEEQRQKSWEMRRSHATDATMATW